MKHNFFSLITFFVGVTVGIAFCVFIIQFQERKLVTFNSNTTSPSPEPFITTIPIASNSSEMSTPTEWSTNAYIDEMGIARFSYTYPPVGQFCNGCVDAWPSNAEAPNVRGTRISGEYSAELDASEWVLAVGTIYETDAFPAEKSSVPTNQNAAKMVNDIKDLKVGSSVITVNEAGESIRAKKITQSNLQDGTAHIYEATYTDPQAASSPRKNYQLAIIPRPGFSAVVKFEYDQDKPDYNHFMRIVNSVAFNQQ